ncbi:MAG TPA: hypothetical protein VM942_00175 [Acidimicrobiales bacterium]|nr:hypothetical protein [Acidimicrobiales bacterium]
MDDPSAMENEMTAAELSTEFDRLSLHQTLIDFEIANARVRDLTTRLVEANREVFLHRQELARLNMEYEKLRSERQAIVDLGQSKTYQLAKMIVSIRRRLTHN